MQTWVMGTGLQTWKVVVVMQTWLVGGVMQTWVVLWKFVLVDLMIFPCRSERVAL